MPKDRAVHGGHDAMLTFPIKSHRRRTKAVPPAVAPSPPPPPPPPSGVTVVSVTVASGNELDFTFSAPVTVDASPPSGQPWVQMPVFGPESAGSAQQIDETI